jgi:ACT domain-containing protein
MTKAGRAKNDALFAGPRDFLRRVARREPYRYSCGELIDRRADDMPTDATQTGAPLSGRAIITIIGSDRVGIIAGISNVLADANVNILDISQSVIREFFTMIMMVDLAGSTVSFPALSELLWRKGEQLGVRVEIQREEIFKAMHRV